VEPVAPDEVATASARHAAFYAAFLSSCVCDSSEEPHLWQSLEAERGNVRSAWDWAVRHEQIATLRTMREGMIAWFEHTGRADEWAEVFGSAVRAVRRMVRDRGADARELGWLLLGYGRAQMQRRRFHEAAINFEEALNLGRAMGATALEMQSLLASEEALCAWGDFELANERSRDVLAVAATRMHSEAALSQSHDVLVHSQEARAVMEGVRKEMGARATAYRGESQRVPEQSLTGIILSNVAEGLAHCAETATTCHEAGSAVTAGARLTA
jgi:hypothetical protein